jgi:hypothetical protein
MATETKPRLKPQRPKNDAYVGLLFISLLALITGCVLLYMDYSQYGTQKPTGVPAAKSSPAISMPDLPPADNPKTTPAEEPKTESPKTEAPKTEQPMNPEPSQPEAPTTAPKRAKARPQGSGDSGGRGNPTPSTKPSDPGK